MRATAKLDDRDAVIEASAHSFGLWRICVIAGRRERFLELLERGIGEDEAQEIFFVEAFGPRPAGPPFPDLIANPNCWRA